MNFMTNERKIEILEKINNELEKENQSLKEENEKLKKKLNSNSVDLIVKLQNELRDSIKRVREQEKEYDELNRNMKTIKKEYTKELNMFMKQVK